jgi:hypothetical protein
MIVLIARLIAILIMALFVLRFFAVAQQPVPQPDMNVDAATRKAVIETLIKELNDGYVFADVAKKMEADLNARIAAKEYDPITSATAFAQKLTADLQSISKDKHLRVRYSHKPIPLRSGNSGPTAEQRANFDREMKRLNYGFDRVERLNGNVGYVDLRGFLDPAGGADTVAAAMAFLANTDALIFDLRQNGGGDPAMVALISAYLFGDKPVHLNDLYWRQGNRTDEFWTKPEAAKVKFPNKDIYVLTSTRTFSGAEEFSYNLKNLKRATIIGETTGGGAHPGGSERLADHFSAFIPTGRAINPISKTNWEGTGVEPDIRAPKEHALKIAYLMALNKSLANIKDEQIQAGLKNLITQTEKELDELKAKK